MARIWPVARCYKGKSTLRSMAGNMVEWPRWRVDIEQRGFFLLSSALTSSPVWRPSSLVAGWKHGAMPLAMRCNSS
uniref:Uncharacterized protein n=1 Tax=Oryza nivara TaxID=4536 RepID=A0A0E0FJ52_ORYNI